MLMIYSQFRYRTEKARSFYSLFWRGKKDNLYEVT